MKKKLTPVENKPHIKKTKEGWWSVTSPDGKWWFTKNFFRNHKAMKFVHYLTVSKTTNM